MGDTDDYETRKAKALGVIAARQGALEFTDETPTAGPVTRRPVRTKLYVHVSAAELAARAAGEPQVGEVERLGPATLDLIRDWLDGSKATITPVLDLARTDAVDAHDPPTWMREQVILRDGHCVFPWCGRDARSTDLDHIEAYVPPDEGGPPGQTNPGNLAPLCRRHHRAKTFTAWHYERARDGTHEWTSPHGHTYAVGPHGTRRTSTPAPRRPGGVHARHLTEAARAPGTRWHDAEVSDNEASLLRPADAGDAAQLLALWQRLFDDMMSPASEVWQEHALTWFARHVDDRARARIAVIEVAGELVASAVGTRETGVPNPMSPTGRAVRLANVITLPAHRGRGYATELIRDVVAWAQSAGVDRIDLSATPEGQRIYERLGFTLASAPRLKRIL